MAMQTCDGDGSLRVDRRSGPDYALADNGDADTASVRPMGARPLGSLVAGTVVRFPGAGIGADGLVRGPIWLNGSTEWPALASP